MVYKKVYYYSPTFFNCHMQAIEIQHAQQISSLKEELEQKDKELKEMSQQVL